MVKNGERFYRESVERLAFLILTRFKPEGSRDFKIYILQIENLFTDHKLKEKCLKFLEQ